VALRLAAIRLRSSCPSRADEVVFLTIDLALARIGSSGRVVVQRPDAVQTDNECWSFVISDMAHWLQNLLE
jgi:hypothetical protein